MRCRSIFVLIIILQVIALSSDVLIDGIVTQFFDRVAWITLPILLLLVTANIIIFRKLLRTLRQASEQAQEIDPLHPNIRLPIDTMPNEIRTLVEAVNGALAGC